MFKGTGTGTRQKVCTAVVLAVGVIAAIQSYNHIESLALAHMPPGPASLLDARLMPLSVDGLIVSASLALSRTPRLAQAMLALGVTATVAANVAYGLPQGALAAILCAWPGVCFVGSAELLLRGRHSSRDATEDATTALQPFGMPELPAPAPVPAAVPEPPAQVVPAEPAPAVPAAVVPKPVPAGRSLADEFAPEIRAGRIPGVKQIQRRMGGNQATAYKRQEQLRQLADTPA